MIRRSAMFAMTLAALLSSAPGVASHSRLAEFPPVMLWAWEHPQDLSFIDPERIGVAFLATTLTLEGAEVRVRPRLQPLALPPETRLMAVARVETRGRPDFSDRQLARLARAIVDIARIRGVSAVQVDYDAPRSQREFHRRLIVELRRSLPDSVGLSVTALASWIDGERWLDQEPVDEIVPMLFRLGPERDRVLRRLGAIAGPRPRREFDSVGLSLDESVIGVRARRTYVFTPGSWDSARVAAALRLAGAPS